MSALAAECGTLSKKRRRVLDSTVLDDAVTTQDTVTMIHAQIRRCRRLVAQAAAAGLGRDYEAAGKPVCDWSDAVERAWLVDDLVTDARAVIDLCEGLDLDAEQSDALGLLAVVAGQDVEADPKVPGRWRIARGVAEGRVISVVDPQARHARKSRSQRRDGYKAHICAEPDTGLITAAELTPANVSDAKVGPRLLNTDTTADTDTADTDGSPRQVLADSAYASGEALEAFAEARYDTAIKPIAARTRIAGGFERADFTIDADAGTVTCPAGHTKAVTAEVARFGKLCAGCPLRHR